MSSLKLFLYLTPFWEPVFEDPIFEREALRPPVWYASVRWLPRMVAAFVAVVIVLNLALARATNPVIFLINNTTCLLLPLVVAIPSLALWALPLGLTLAPVIVRERDQSTWDTLRVTPLPIERIVLSKAGGALWWLRNAMRSMRVILFIAAWAVALIGLTELERANLTLSTNSLCGLALVMMIVSGALFLLDRAQQFVVMIVAALAASATAPSQRTATSWAVMAAFGAWLIDVCFAALVLTAIPGASLRYLQFRFVILFVLGPTAAYGAELPLAAALLAILGTLLLREIVVRALWRWAVVAARG